MSCGEEVVRVPARPPGLRRTTTAPPQMLLERRIDHMAAATHNVVPRRQLTSDALPKRKPSKEEEKNESESENEDNENENETGVELNEEEEKQQDQFWGVVKVPVFVPLVPHVYVSMASNEEESPRERLDSSSLGSSSSEVAVTDDQQQQQSLSSSSSSSSLDHNEEESREDEAPPLPQEFLAPVPPRPVLPKRHSAEPSRAKIGAVSAAPQPLVEEGPLVPVPPRPVLLKKPRSSTFDNLQLESQGCVPVPARPRLPTRAVARSDGELLQQQQHEVAQQPQAATKEPEEEDPEQRRRREQQAREEEHRRRVQEQERLAPFAPQLLYSDSFYQNRKKQEADSLEELRVLREEERRKAIEREREKAMAKPVHIEELNVRPASARQSYKEDVPHHHHQASAAVHLHKASEGRETLRREGILLVRAIDNFKGLKLGLTPDGIGKKRKQLKFKLNDVIRVSAVNEEEGLYFGALDKSSKGGWFPSFYVVPIVK